MNLTILMKLGSIARHADELLNDEGVATTKAGEFDVQAILSLLADSEVQHELSRLDELALLPVKRGAS